MSYIVFKCYIISCFHCPFYISSILICITSYSSYLLWCILSLWQMRYRPTYNLYFDSCSLLRQPSFCPPSSCFCLWVTSHHTTTWQLSVASLNVWDLINQDLSLQYSTTNGLHSIWQMAQVVLISCESIVGWISRATKLLSIVSVDVEGLLRWLNVTCFCYNSKVQWRRLWCCSWGTQPP